MNSIEVIKEAQKNEITEFHIYKSLSKVADAHNARVLNQIAEEELGHYNLLKEITNTDFGPNNFKIWLYTFLEHLFGLMFVLKLMESNEGGAQNLYNKVKGEYEVIAKIIDDEEAHELKLLDILRDEKVEYAGAIVLGLNDALVELSGSIAGLSLTLGSTKLIGLAGIIIGVAASLSMAASSYLSSKETRESNPIKAALYTGIAYVVTVFLLVAPYFLLANVIYALMVMIAITLIVIASYTFYISVVKGESFKKRFIEMAIISVGVATISFIIGWLLHGWLNV